MEAPHHPVEDAARARTRAFFRRLPILTVAAAFAVFAASALAGSNAATGSFVINGSIVGTDPVVSDPIYSSGRLACPGSYGAPLGLSGNYHYKAYRFRSLRSIDTCANVSLAVSSGTAAVVGYWGPFDPLNPINKLAASTGGLGAGQAKDVEYKVAPGATFDVIVWESTQNGGAAYTLLVEGLGIVMSGGGPTATSGLQSFRATPTRTAMLVSWRTRTEREALGFNLYRGDGKKIRLTRGLVRASSDGRGHTYSYIDRTPQRGKAGRYWLQVVQTSGSKLMFGPARNAS